MGKMEWNMKIGVLREFYWIILPFSHLSHFSSFTTRKCCEIGKSKSC